MAPLSLSMLALSWTNVVVPFRSVLFYTTSRSPPQKEITPKKKGEEIRVG